MAQPKSTKTKKSTTAKDQPKRSGLILSRGKVIGLSIALVIILGWVFVLGVLIGRGYRPEETVPEIAHLMPMAPEKGAVPQEQGTLKAEDLDYMEALREKPPAPPKQAPEKKKEKPKPQKKIVREQPEVEKHATATRSAPAETSSAKLQTAPEVTPRKTDIQPVSSEPRYSYVYQVAAFKALSVAEQLQKRIRSSGYGSIIESVRTDKGTWYRVQVLFRGTPEETRTLKSDMHAIGVNRLIMKEKTPL